MILKKQFDLFTPNGEHVFANHCLNLPAETVLTVKCRSLGKCQLSVKIAKALISQGSVEVKNPMEDGKVNFLNLKRKIVVRLEFQPLFRENEPVVIPPKAQLDA